MVRIHVENHNYLYRTMIISQEQYQHYKKNQGYVYLIHAEGTNRYKIGRSINPLKRYEQLQGQSPFPLRVENCVWSPDSVLLEKQLHDRFCDFRVHGEWFELEDDGYINIRFLNYRSEFSEIIQQIFDCLWQYSENYCYKHLVLDRLKKNGIIKNDEEFVKEYGSRLIRSIDAFLRETNDLNKFVLKTTFLTCFYKIDAFFKSYYFEKYFLSHIGIAIGQSFKDSWEIFEQGYDMGLKKALIIRTFQENTTVDEKGGKQ